MARSKTPADVASPCRECQLGPLQLYKTVTTIRGTATTELLYAIASPTLLGLAVPNVDLGDMFARLGYVAVQWSCCSCSCSSIFFVAVVALHVIVIAIPFDIVIAIGIAAVDVAVVVAVAVAVVCCCLCSTPGNVEHTSRRSEVRDQLPASEDQLLKGFRTEGR